MTAEKNQRIRHREADFSQRHRLDRFRRPDLHFPPPRRDLPVQEPSASAISSAESSGIPISDPPKLGILPLILGSLLVTAGAIVLAVPLGIAAAFYIAEIVRPKARDILKSCVEILSAIPSVVLGFIGMVTLVPFIKKALRHPDGPDRPGGLDHAGLHGPADDHQHLRGRHQRRSPRIQGRGHRPRAPPTGRRSTGSSSTAPCRASSPPPCSASAASSARPWPS